MKKFAIATIVLGAVLVSCGDPGKLPAKVKQERVDVVLTDQDLFKGNMVAAFLENDKKFIKESNELFLKGVNAYRNLNKLDSAQFYFVSSIKKEPSAKAYFELGNVYMDEKDFDAALQSYAIAEQLDYEPFSKILYNKSCIYSLQEKNELAGQYLEYALQAGYNNIEHIQKDADLSNLRETMYYKQAVDKGLRGMSNAENLFWLQFKKLFPAMPAPTELKLTLSDEVYQSLKYISYDYEKYISEMRDAMFARDVTSSYLYYGRPYETDEFVAVIYIVKDEWMGDYAPLKYKMATFTHDGKLIDKKVIGGSEDSDLDGTFIYAKLKKDMTIQGTLVEPQYEKDPDEHGYYDNKIKSYKKVGTQNFRVTKAGKIIEEEPALTAS